MVIDIYVYINIHNQISSERRFGGVSRPSTRICLPFAIQEPSLTISHRPRTAHAVELLLVMILCKEISRVCNSRKELTSTDRKKTVVSITVYVRKSELRSILSNF